MNTLKRLLQEEDGGTAVEYGLLIALVAVALIGTFKAFGGKLQGWIEDNGDSIVTASPNGE